MSLWFFQRLFQSLILVLAMSLTVFIGLHAIGNPVDILIGEDLNQDERQQAIEELGLDQPLWRQYTNFVSGALSGNFGKSFVYHEDAIKVILQRLPATLELAITAMLIAIVMGVSSGLFAGLHPTHWFSKVLVSGSIIGFSLPAFWLGLLMIMFFSVYLGWLPSGGRAVTREFLGIPCSWLSWEGMKYLIMPAMTIAFLKISLVLRITRASVREVVHKDYIKFAQAKGISSTRLIFKHILRNALLPLITILGVELGSTISYAVITETIFSWPGTGKLIIDSINTLDRPVVVAYLMIVVFLFVSINLVVDVFYRLLDPRIK